MSMAYFVYILQSEQDGSYYIGHTADLKERIQRHNQGRSLYTRLKIPWKLIYHEVYGSRVEAMRREKEIKSTKSKKYIEQLVRTSRV
jgi:putative endonuclease